MSNHLKHNSAGWALAAVSILVIAGLGSISSCSGRDQSDLIILATSNTDTIAPDGHVLYDVHAWTTTGAKVTKVSVTEMSDESGLRLVEEREENKTDVKERFDYSASPVTKDTSEFVIIFNAEDDLGNTQEYQRRLHIIRPKTAPAEGKGEDVEKTAE